MKKRSQYSSFGPTQAGTVTLLDLYQAVGSDTSMGAAERDRLLAQIAALVGGASPDTPLSRLMPRGLGAGLGWLVSRYFAMGPLGQLLSTAAGYGIGGVVARKLNPGPRHRVRGWEML